MPGGDVNNKQLMRYIELERETQKPEAQNVDKKQLMRYIELEREIQKLETQNVMKTYDMRKKAVEDVQETIKSVERTLEDQVKQTKKEKDDVDKTIREMFKDESTYKKELTREQEEYLEAKNKEEVTRQQLEGLKKQKNELDGQVNEVKEPAEKLKNLYEERDTLLSDIFDGEYGSEVENKLEAQFDVLMEKKQRIGVAHYKWTSARVLLTHAVSQMQHACAKWRECGAVDQRNMQHKYSIATEARNNLIAAMQNIQSTQRYLSSITFPYCQPQEMETLQRATNNIYTDMASPQRHQHAGQCYDVTMRRAGALLQWFDNVIQGTINKDLQSATTEARKVEQQLRAERIRLIRAKVEESGESTKDLNVADQQKLCEQDMDVQNIGITRPEGVGEDPNLPDMQRLNVDEDLRPPPTPIPLSDLAPMPSENELFGDINELKEQYKKNTEDYMKAQQMNKARMEQGLQAKLQERRHRRK